MAVSALTIPSQIQLFNAPVDEAMRLTASETLTATGYMGSTTSTTTLDLGGANPVAAVGRHDGILNVLISAIDFASNDETYRMFLMGSNDGAWGNGNIETLVIHDLAAVTAGRLVPTISSPTPAIPPTNLSGTLLQFPFTNLMQRIYYRFLRGYWVIGGTTPSITYQAWISKADIKV